MNLISYSSALRRRKMATLKQTAFLFINSNTQISPSFNSLSSTNLFQPPFNSVRRRVNAHRTPHHTLQLLPSPTSSFISIDSFMYLSPNFLGKLCIKFIKIIPKSLPFNSSSFYFTILFLPDNSLFECRMASSSP